MFFFTKYIFIYLLLYFIIIYLFICVEHSEGVDADNQFIFNHDLFQRYSNTPLMKYTPHLMSGFCEQIKDCNVENHYFNMILISRKSRYHSGTRFNTRGLQNSKCANFVETEEIIQMINENQEATEEYYSVTQIRGSIPLYWQQNVTLKYTPKVTISNDEQQNKNGFLTHVKEITSQYGGITIVNLIDKKKDQLTLGKEYEKYSNELKDQYKLHYIWFDFHKECAKMKWENLSKLMADIDADIKAYGYFHIKSDGSTIDKKQTGVCRTNCMDNLDRTNVVQSLIGRRVILFIFDSPSSLTLENVLSSPYSQFEVLFKGIWSDNADRLSYLYSGTNALKTDFTRTGKRTFQGLMDDGYNSMMRYYLNNFCDGCKQDAINLLVGDYSISEDVCKKIAKKQNAFVYILYILIFHFFSLNFNNRLCF